MEYISEISSRKLRAYMKKAKDMHRIQRHVGNLNRLDADRSRDLEVRKSLRQASDTLLTKANNKRKYSDKARDTLRKRNPIRRIFSREQNEILENKSSSSSRQNSGSSETSTGTRAAAAVGAVTAGSTISAVKQAVGVVGKAARKTYSAGKTAFSKSAKTGAVRRAVVTAKKASKTSTANYPRTDTASQRAQDSKIRNANKAAGRPIEQGTSRWKADAKTFKVAKPTPKLTISGKSKSTESGRSTGGRGPYVGGAKGRSGGGFPTLRIHPSEVRTGRSRGILPPKN